VYVAALGRPDGAVAPAERGFLLGGALVGLGDAYGAIRTLARRSALSLDRDLGLGLEEALRAYDPQAPPQRRDRDLADLVRRFEAAARARLKPPPPGRLLGADYRFDFGGVRALIDRQSSAEIAIGE
jgi:hypothetical protein